MADQQDIIQILIQARDEASGTVAKLETAINGLQGSATQASQATGSLFGEFVKGNVATEVLYKSLDFLKGQFMSIISQVEEADRVHAQLFQALRSTGSQAGVTATSTLELADKISRLDAVSRESVMSAEAMLLTFTNIHAVTFPRATQAVVDMATAMGSGATPSAEELRATAIQLGKALNDPTIGLTALQRVGVTFSAEQKKVIETMAKTGDVAGAQKLILDELSKEFGGSAAAAAQTFEGRTKALTIALNEQKEKIGHELMPIATEWVNELVAMVGQTDENSTSTESMSVMFYQAGKMAEFVGGQLVVFGKVIALLSQELVDAAGIIGDAFGGVFVGIRDQFVVFGKDLKGLLEASKGDFKQAQKDFEESDQLGKKAWNFTALKEGMKTAADDFKKGSASIADSWQASGLAMSQALDTDAIVQKISNANDAQKASVKILDEAAQKAKDFYEKLGTDGSKADAKIATAAKDYSDKLVDINDRLGKTIVDFATKSGEALDAYTKKINDLNDKVKAAQDDWAEQQADRATDVADTQKKQHAEVVKAYMDDQDKMLKLQQSSNPDLSEFDRLQKEINLFTNSFEGIAGEAAAERAKSPIDKLNEKFAEEKAASDKAWQKKVEAHNKEMADLQKQLQEENDAYKEAKDKLILDTQSKYVALLKEVSDGWDKVIDTAKGKVAALKAVEDQANQLRGLIQLTSDQSATSAVQPSLAGKRASGGPVLAGQLYQVNENGQEFFRPSMNGEIIPVGGAAQSAPAPQDSGDVHIHVMEGATVRITNGMDVNELSSRVARELARTIQARRNGLATSN